MPKLERSRLDLRKPCYPRPAGVPESKEHGSGSHPDNARARRVGRASASWRIFRTSETTRHLGRRGAGVYRSQLGPFAACRHTRRQGGPRQQSHVIVAHRDECAPRPSWSFVIRVHKFQKGCCQTYYFLSGVLSPAGQRLQIQQVSCRPRLPYDNNGPCEELELLLLYPHQHIRPLCGNERAPAVIVSGSETYVV